VELDGDQPRHAGFRHGDAVEPLGAFHGALGLRDRHELRAAGPWSSLPEDSTACGFLNASGENRTLTAASSQDAGRMNGKRCACLTRQAGRNNIVIIMRAVHVSIRRIGNSHGVVIPKPVLAQLGLDVKAGVEMTIEDSALVLRRPASPPRTGWADAAKRIAEAGDDELVMGEFGNAGDSELVW